MLQRRFHRLAPNLENSQPMQDISEPYNNLTALNALQKCVEWSITKGSSGIDRHEAGTGLLTLILRIYAHSKLKINIAEAL